MDYYAYPIYPNDHKYLIPGFRSQAPRLDAPHLFFDHRKGNVIPLFEHQPLPDSWKHKYNTAHTDTYTELKSLAMPWARSQSPSQIGFVKNNYLSL